ncbi:MAG: hypothetical protein ACERJ1_08855 [Halodesulfovibrio sp.]|uniref:hypothetical protein n=1 Tax=Halodesulfovibrio sp. TaxID=1912772 RepID=UPI00359DDFFD
MSSLFTTDIPTNDRTGSVHNHVSELMPARAFFFTIVEEVGADGLLVRKIYASVDAPYLDKLDLTPLQKQAEVFPELHGLKPKSPGAATSIAEHVMGNNMSDYISTSSIVPDGSPRFEGKTIFVDIAKAKKSGVQVVTTDEVLKFLSEYEAQHPHLAKRVQKIAQYVRDADKEVLVKGKVPARSVFNKESLKSAKGIVGVGRVVQVLGIVLTAYDLNVAMDESIKFNTVKPISAEVVRQAGGWGAAWAGGKIGVVAGASVGIETGPGAIVSGLIGGIIFGAAGYFGADWIADHIYEN